MFRNFVELLCVMRDCIEGSFPISPASAPLTSYHQSAHRDLVLKKNVLHRDISINNVLINRSSSASTLGFLIDFDLAIDLQRSQNSGAKHRTGTFHFMAIGLLQGHEHSYRHDLESFFYILLYLCTYYSGPGGQKRDAISISSLSLFEKCSTVARFTDDEAEMMALVSDIKLAALSKASFRDESLPTLAPLMRQNLMGVLIKWREVLFPLNYDEGRIEVKAVGSPAELYSKMLAILTEEIEQLEVSSQATHAGD
jgi:serine/threonine protein kinase